MNTVILDGGAIARTVIRLSHEVEERNRSFSDLAFIGIRRGGEVVAKRIAAYLYGQTGEAVPCAGIDISAFRDDDKRSNNNFLNDFGFSVEGKTVILCDDVLQTGRTVRAAVDGLFAVGRPKEIQLVVLVDRGGREVPVRADYVGKNFPAGKDERIEAQFMELGFDEDKFYLTKIR